MRKKPYSPPAKDTRFNVHESIELMTFLLTKMGGMSRTSVKSLLSHRQVSVNGTIVTQFNLPLHPHDVVVINSNKGNIELTHPKLKVIFEDSYIIVVEKKEGLLTVNPDNETETTVFSILKHYVKKASAHNRVFTVHRLDRDTSGILIFAKSKEIQLALQENWHRAVTRRLYTAVVEGKMEHGMFLNSSTQATAEKSETNRTRVQHSADQRNVIHPHIVKSNDELSLLEIELGIGQKNEIRFQLHEVGHPIIGDKKYGATSNPIRRMGLHARSIEFYHPVTQHKVAFDSAIPRNFLQLFH